MKMAPIKEWRCAQHGDFDGSHPICPSMGCASEHVERVFRTPVGISKGNYKRFDAGLRRTADVMGIRNFRTAHEGEAGYAGRAAEADAPIGQKLLWGPQEVQKVMGVSLANQLQAAQQPLSVPNRDPGTDPYLTVNNGMRASATTLGITRQVLPPAEIIREKAAP
jgi:hypothetical protein